MNRSEHHAEFLRAATEVWRQRISVQLAGSPRTAAGRRALATQRETFGDALAAIHAGLIARATPPQHPAVAAVVPAYLALVNPRITHRGQSFLTIPPSSHETGLRLLVVEWLVQHTTCTRPAVLLGALYALADIVLMVEVSKEGDPLGLNAGAWAMFQATLNAAPLDPGEQAQIAAAAAEIFAELVGLFDSLEPRVPRPLRQLVGVLNPAAGKHAIPDDLEEIRAAVQAGARSWREFPYYQMRYVARGIRYTWSDSAWLVTLCDAPPGEVHTQVAWLGRLLATRGMPQWLLECHLELLYAELAHTHPARAAYYAPLAQAAQSLKAVRLAHMSEALSAELAAAFVTLAEPALARQLPETGHLIAAAVADERAGIAGALPSVADWLIDPTRFPPRWVTVVQHLLQMAQKHAGL